MPKIAYSEAERAEIREKLIATGLELFAAQGVMHTTVAQIYTRVGISRTFFYSFFPAKEDLVLQAFYLQQPRIVAYAKRLTDDPGLTWRDGIRQFLNAFCATGEGRFAIMTVEEQQDVFRHLSAEKYKTLKERQLRFFADILQTFGISADETTVKFLCNVLLSAVIVRKAIPATLPFLFPEAADAMVRFQIDALIDHMEKLRARQNDK